MSDGTEVLAELLDRCERARHTLLQMGAELPASGPRLVAKASGVDLAISYIGEALRTVRQKAGGS